jgi:hypothetical protein
MLCPTTLKSEVETLPVLLYSKYKNISKKRNFSMVQKGFTSRGKNGMKKEEAHYPYF